MITIETVTVNNRELVHTYSDTYTIRKVGTDEIYTEAYDVPDSGYTYEETEEPLPENEYSELERRVSALEDAMIELAEVVGNG